MSEAQVVFGVNAYRELCGLHLGGSSLTSHDLILQCANGAAKRAAEVVQIMKSALKEDADARYDKFQSHLHEYPGITILFRMEETLLTKVRLI